MIVVIQSLREGDMPTGRLLREDIEVVALPYGRQLEVHFKTARSADDLEFLLRELNGYAYQTVVRRYCTLIATEDRDGIQLTDGSYMPWKRLKPLLVE